MARVSVLKLQASQTLDRGISVKPERKRVIESKSLSAPWKSGSPDAEALIGKHVWGCRRPRIQAFKAKKITHFLVLSGFVGAQRQPNHEHPLA